MISAVRSLCWREEERGRKGERGMEEEREREGGVKKIKLFHCTSSHSATLPPTPPLLLSHTLSPSTPPPHTYYFEQFLHASFTAVQQLTHFIPWV